MEELICTFCRQHAFLFIFLLVSPLSAPLKQGCAVSLFQSGGVVTSDGWLSTFCCLPLRSWEIYRLADYQAWKPISLSHSCLPSSIHTSLGPSILLSLFLHLLYFYTFIMERCVQNNGMEFVCGQGEIIAPLGGYCGSVRRDSIVIVMCCSLTAHLVHLHLSQSLLKKLWTSIYVPDGVGSSDTEEQVLAVWSLTWSPLILQQCFCNA